MSVRTDFAEQLRQDLPGLVGNIRVIATEAELDDIQQTTALIRVRSIGKTPSAPLSHRNVGLLLTLISQHQDADRAVDEMDDVVNGVLDYLDPRFAHEDATAVSYGDRLAFDIPVTIIASKE